LASIGLSPRTPLGAGRALVPPAAAAARAAGALVEHDDLALAASEEAQPEGARPVGELARAEGAAGRTRHQASCGW
jgi:NAD/NADP transhydrogenase alpha subunit